MSSNLLDDLSVYDGWCLNPPHGFIIFIQTQSQPPREGKARQVQILSKVSGEAFCEKTNRHEGFTISIFILIRTRDLGGEYSGVHLQLSEFELDISMIRQIINKLVTTRLSHVKMSTYAFHDNPSMNNPSLGLLPY